MNLQTNTKSPLIVPLRHGSEIFYPESDGEPVAETDTHRSLLAELIN